MSLNTIIIKSRLKDYKVSFHKETDYIQSLSEITNSIFIIDKKVWVLHKEKSLHYLKDVEKLYLDINEGIKNLDTVQMLYDKIVNHPAKKNLSIISIGGGITQDITGFFASTIYRGVNWIYIPTTLLAQADSCIGAKTSLNYKSFKNLIGTFYPPNEIHISMDFLHTLSELDLYSGLGEIFKLFIINGRQTLDKACNNLTQFRESNSYNILTELIRESLLIKKVYIEEDEFDKGKRNILNYGHCIGHAIESSSNYLIPHGQAVVIGMMLANIISRERGLLNNKDENSIFNNALKPILKKKISEINPDTDKIINGIKQDKKREGEGLPLIILKNEFNFEKINNLNYKELNNSIKELKDRLND
jgi:3-dehydroquinate synthase